MLCAVPASSNKGRWMEGLASYYWVHISNEMCVVGRNLCPRVPIQARWKCGVKLQGWPKLSAKLVWGFQVPVTSFQPVVLGLWPDHDRYYLT